MLKLMKDDALEAFMNDFPQFSDISYNGEWSLKKSSVLGSVAVITTGEHQHMVLEQPVWKDYFDKENYYTYVGHDFVIHVRQDKEVIKEVPDVHDVEWFNDQKHSE